MFPFSLSSSSGCFLSILSSRGCHGRQPGHAAPCRPCHLQPTAPPTSLTTAATTPPLPLPSLRRLAAQSSCSLCPAVAMVVGHLHPDFFALESPKSIPFEALKPPQPSPTCCSNQLHVSSVNHNQFCRFPRHRSMQTENYRINPWAFRINSSIAFAV